MKYFLVIVFRGVTSLLTSLLLSFILIAPLNAAEDKVNSAQKLEELTQEDSDDHLTIGLLVVDSPTYLGSETSKTSVAPSVSFSYGILFGEFGSIGLYLYNSEIFTASVSLGLAGDSREGKDVKHLKNVRDVEGTVTGIVSLGFNVSVVSITLEYVANLEEDEIKKEDETKKQANKGSKASFAISSVYPLYDDLLLIGEGKGTYGNQDYMNTFFGVDSVQAGLSSIDEFKPEPSVFSYEGSLILQYSFAKDWSALVLASYTKYQNDAAISPLLKQDHGSTYGIGVNYQVYGG